MITGIPKARQGRRALSNGYASLGAQNLFDVCPDFLTLRKFATVGGGDAFTNGGTEVVILF